MAAPSDDKPHVHLDEYGVERWGDAPKPTLNDKIRARSQIYNRLYEMQERYSQQGGSQYAAGITYFSVLAVVPLLMVGFSIAGYVLGGSPELSERVEDVVRENIGGQLGDTIVDVMQAAISQTGSVATVAFLVGMWTGLYWMTTLRRGMTSIWKRNIVPEHWVLGKLRDLFVLVGMGLMIILTFTVTAVASPGVLQRILDFIGRGDNDLDRLLIRTATLVIGLVANWILFFWMLKALPFGHVPTRPAFGYAIIGAIGLELIKSFGSMFFASALRNPAGAMFGPVIGLMVILYLLWRMTMYLAALTATSKEGMATVEVEAPPPAVVMIRPEAATEAGFTPSAPEDHQEHDSATSPSGRQRLSAITAAFTRTKGEGASGEKDHGSK